MIGDTQSRQETPCRIMPLGFNGTAGSDQNLLFGSTFGQSVNYGDLKQLVSFGGAHFDGSFNAVGLNEQGAVQKQNLVRMPTLHSGEITQIYLTFRLRLGNDEPSTRSMWVGFADVSQLGGKNNLLHMDEQKIKDAHRMIVGDATGFQAGAGGYIQFNRLNITELFKRSRKGNGIWGLTFLFDQKPARSYDAGNFYNAIETGYQMQVFRVEAMARFKGTQG